MVKASLCCKLFLFLRALKDFLLINDEGGCKSSEIGKEIEILLGGYQSQAQDLLMNIYDMFEQTEQNAVELKYLWISQTARSVNNT